MTGEQEAEGASQQDGDTGVEPPCQSVRESKALCTTSTSPGDSQRPEHSLGDHPQVSPGRLQMSLGFPCRALGRSAGESQGDLGEALGKYGGSLREICGGSRNMVEP